MIRSRLGQSVHRCRAARAVSTVLARRVGAFAVVVLLLAGCSAPPAAAQTHTVRGVLLDVESPGIQKVDSFTLRSDDGQELQFSTAPDFNQGVAHLMTPGHMRQHMALGDPVEVTYRDDNGAHIALSATDVSGP